MSEGPTQFVIFGGTGDLARRKLIPALLDLYKRKRLPEQFQIIGFAKTKRTDSEYREFIKGIINEHTHEHTAEEVDAFCDTLSYITGTFEDDESYERIGSRLTTYKKDIGQCTNKLFYLAVPPSSYSVIFKKLAHSGIAKECSEEEGWSRVLVEKPFGSDLKSAQELDTELSKLFKEDQIFRIDHYLAKEAVQNILSFRFANTLFHGAWNKTYIQEVRIQVHETVDVSTRGLFYNKIGALRDVGENHMLQLLALIAMQQPENFDAEAIRGARTDVLQHLWQMDAKSITTNVVRGQYKGYESTKGVSSDSHTETFFELRAYVDTDEWQGVPFYLSSGKALDKAEVKVDIYFKPVASGIFGKEVPNMLRDRITLVVSPEQSMQITLVAKAPGLEYNLEYRDLSFVCEKGEAEITNSYEKVLLDCISGDQTLFASTRGVFAAWEFVDSVIAHWNEVPLQIYEPGSSGPKDRLLSK